VEDGDIGTGCIRRQLPFLIGIIRLFFVWPGRSSASLRSPCFAIGPATTSCGGVRRRAAHPALALPRRVRRGPNSPLAISVASSFACVVPSVEQGGGSKSKAPLRCLDCRPRARDSPWRRGLLPSRRDSQKGIIVVWMPNDCGRPVAGSHERQLSGFSTTALSGAHADA
jgi:hypothetical protein